MKFEIPRPLKIEHENLHEMLRKATKEPGELGDAAKAVAELMHPHFLKEEEYALDAACMDAREAITRVLAW